MQSIGQQWTLDTVIAISNIGTLDTVIAISNTDLKWHMSIFCNYLKGNARELNANARELNTCVIGG